MPLVSSPTVTRGTVPTAGSWRRCGVNPSVRRLTPLYLNGKACNQCRQSRPVSLTQPISSVAWQELPWALVPLPICRRCYVADDAPPIPPGPPGSPSPRPPQTAPGGLSCTRGRPQEDAIVTLGTVFECLGCFWRIPRTFPGSPPPTSSREYSCSISSRDRRLEDAIVTQGWYQYPPDFYFYLQFPSDMAVLFCLIGSGGRRLVDVIVMTGI